MITQKIDLNLIHGQVRPRVNVSQYDNGSRTLEIAVYNNTARFTLLSSYNATIEGRKPDGLGFQYTGTIDTVNNVATFDVTTQMTAISGDVVVEMVLTDSNENRIATGNFILAVEAAPLNDDSVISDSDLPLVERAAEIAEEIDAIVGEVEAAAGDAEAYAVGTRAGVPVASGDPAYNNNAKYYAENFAGYMPDTMYTSIQTLFNS